MNDQYTEHVDRESIAVDSAEAANIRAGMQNEHATHDYVLEAFKTDPQLRSMLGDHFLEKGSLAPAQVFELWVQDPAAVEALQTLQSLPAAEKADFLVNSTLLQQKINATKQVLESQQADQVEAIDENMIEAQTCFDTIKDQFDPPCPPAAESEFVGRLARLAENKDLIELALTKSDFLVGKLQPQINKLVEIQKENEAQVKENEVQVEKDEVIENDKAAIQVVLDRIKKNPKGTVNLDDIDIVLGVQVADGTSAWEKMFNSKEEADDFATMHESFLAIRARIDSAVGAIDPATDPEAHARAKAIFENGEYNWQSSNPEEQFKAQLEIINGADSGFTQEQKDAMSVALGVPAPVAKTGTDIQETLTAGYIDPATGERKPFTKENPSALNEGTVIYEKNDGTRVVAVTLPDGRELSGRFTADIGGAKVGQIAYTLQMMYAAERLNLAEPIFHRGWNITHGGEIDLHYDDVIRAQKIGDSLVGGGSGRDGRILDNARIDGLRHRFQAFNSKGDETTYVNDPEAATRDLQELGIVDDGGKLVWEEFDKAAHYLQKVEAKGGKPDFQLLKNFLQGENPEESGNSQS